MGSFPSDPLPEPGNGSTGEMVWFGGGNGSIPSSLPTSHLTGHGGFGAEGPFHRRAEGPLGREKTMSHFREGNANRRPGCMTGSSSIGALFHPFLFWGEGSPTKIDYRKVGTLILASLEGLDESGSGGHGHLAVFWGSIQS